MKMPVVYDKAKLLTLDRYANRRDLLSALLEDGKEYTKDQVDGLIKDFMERTATIRSIEGTMYFFSHRFLISQLASE